MNQRMNVATDERVSKVKSYIEDSGRSYVRTNHLDGKLDMKTDVIGICLSELADRGDLKLYRETGRGRLYRVKMD